MVRYACVYVYHTHLDNWSAPSCYFTTAISNDCYSEVVAYTALDYSRLASFHDAYIIICLRHAHYRYRLQPPYKSHRTYLTNRMGYMQYHTTSRHWLLMVSGRTRTHTDIRGRRQFAGRRALSITLSHWGPRWLGTSPHKQQGSHCLHYWSLD